MPQQCSICISEDRVEIEKEMEAGTSNRAVAKKFNSNEKTIRRHRQHGGFDVGEEDRNGGKTMSLLQMAKIPNGEKTAAMIDDEIAALREEVGRQQQLEHRARFRRLDLEERRGLLDRYGVDQRLVSDPDEQLRVSIFNHWRGLEERVEILNSLSPTVEKSREARGEEIEEMERRAKQELDNVEVHLGRHLLELWTANRNPKNNLDVDREDFLKSEVEYVEKKLQEKREQLYRVELAKKALGKEVDLDIV